MAECWEGALGYTGSSLPVGRGNNSEQPGQAQKIQLRASTDGRQTELWLILCDHFKFLVIFRAKGPWPFRAAAGTAWHPLDALTNVGGEFGSYTGVILTLLCNSLYMM